jgi:hypothetical protein
MTSPAIQAPESTDSSKGLLLVGLDGSNPLGFLAALGTLRALSRQHLPISVKLAWRADAGVWHPAILGAGTDMDRMVDRVKSGLAASDPSPWFLSKKLPFEATCLRNAAVNAVGSASMGNRDQADVLAAFGVELFQDDNGMFEETSLCMVRAGDSAGNGLLGYGTRIRDNTTHNDLRKALLEPWRYEDEGCALRWDPAENHGYALQWTNPSKESTVSVRGANRLAIEAMPLLPTIPGRRQVETTAFGLPDGKKECLTWPIWQIPISMSVVQSLLTLQALQCETPRAAGLRERGICAVYRCDRIMTSKYYRNFTPAQRIA